MNNKFTQKSIKKYHKLITTLDYVLASVFIVSMELFNFFFIYVNHQNSDHVLQVRQIFSNKTEASKNVMKLVSLQKFLLKSNTFGINEIWKATLNKPIFTGSYSSGGSLISIVKCGWFHPNFIRSNQSFVSLQRKICTDRLSLLPKGILFPYREQFWAREII